MVKRETTAAKSDGCVVCGKPRPEGPRGYAWDAHVVDMPGGASVLDWTCSRECRARGGYTERKPLP